MVSIAASPTAVAASIDGIVDVSGLREPPSGSLPWVALGTGALMLWGGLGGSTPTPAGRGPVFFLAGLCLLAGSLDLRVVLRGRLTAGERIRRHLWRMCFAFFIATGSFFLGQQRVMPVAVRGSPVLFVLAFAPFAVNQSPDCLPPSPWFTPAKVRSEGCFPVSTPRGLHR